MPHFVGYVFKELWKLDIDYLVEASGQSRTIMGIGGTVHVAGWDWLYARPPFVQSPARPPSDRDLAANTHVSKKRNVGTRLSLHYEHKGGRMG